MFTCNLQSSCYYIFSYKNHFLIKTVMDSKTMKSNFQSIIPKLTHEAHKGQSGRVGIIGGSKNFTGAPYFAAISALKVGCDLIHVFCTNDASTAIKCYNPELIVHPILDSATFCSEISVYISNLHSLVIGPGLGREEHVFQSMNYIINLAKENNIPLVLDADALFYLNNNLSVISNYAKAIITPNKVEFERLYKAVTNNPLIGDVTINNVEEVSKLLGNITVVRKGPTDIISDGKTTLVCDEPGSYRRCGGQGDVLAGSLGTFNYWAHNSSLMYSAPVVAAFGACLLTRKCSFLAFQKYKRSMVTSNLIDEINQAFTSLFGCE